MNQILKNIKKVVGYTPSLISGIIASGVIFGMWVYFTDKVQVIWNLWYNFYIWQVIVDTSIALLFGLFLAATVYKILYFSSASSKQIGGWLLGWLFWVLVSWCPLCSITLASYLGLAGILWVLPYGWIELKVVSIVILLYAVYSTLKNLEVCNIKK